MAASAWSGLTNGLSDAGLKVLWSSATLLGTRNLVQLLPRQYRDTTFYFDGLKGCVALTIDDGLSRGGPRASMVRTAPVA